jgi:hypothetical protein
MAKKRRVYQPRVFDDRVITPSRAALAFRNVAAPLSRQWWLHAERVAVPCKFPVLYRELRSPP